MIERVIENWLTNASERSFQLPFCYVLENKGHKILHLTRHRPIEFGKDVITLDSKGHYHAFQLKKGNITQNGFNKLIEQLRQLCYLNLSHPSVPKGATYKPYLVTNGNVDEEVYRALEDFNSGLIAANRQKLQILKFDDLYSDFINLGSKLWPSELIDYKTIIEFSIQNGKSNFPIKKFISLLESQLELSTSEIKSIKNLPSAKRSITSSAILTSLCVTNYLENDNHVAIVECWVVYISQIMALIKKLDLEENDFKEEIELGKTIIYQSLVNLSDEIEERDDLFEGNIIYDRPFYNDRATKIVGLLSTLYLWSLQFDDSEVISKNVSLSIKKFLPDTRLISESQIPFFLSVYWFLRRIDATEHPVRYLKMIIDSIIASSKDGQGLPNPYYKVQDLIPIIIQNELQKEINPSMSLGADPIDDHFKYDSFYLEGLVHLYVRYNYKQEMKFTWSKITRFRFK